MRCHACGRPLTGSWSKGRNGRFAYYHCRGECRDINIAKAKLEGLFVDELARLQPSHGYMRLVILSIRPLATCVGDRQVYGEAKTF